MEKKLYAVDYEAYSLFSYGRLRTCAKMIILKSTSVVVDPIRAQHFLITRNNGKMLCKYNLSACILYRL